MISLNAILMIAAATQAPALPTFMTGCWDLVNGESWTQECWMEPKGGMMLGASREGKGAKLRSWEQLRIVQAEDSTITLFASPQGAPALPFHARNVSSTAIEFINTKNDYPQRIRYELKGDKLEAEISLIDGSKPFRWSYNRESK